MKKNMALVGAERSYKRVFFLAGLPRSGSTLLANVFAQNPAFGVTSTSALPEIVAGMQAKFGGSPQRMAASNHEQLIERFRGAVRGAICGYFDGNKMGVDKSREWMQFRQLLHVVFRNDLKVICPVRDLRGCVASQEKLYEKAPEYSWNDKILANKNERIKFWLSSNPLGRSAAIIQAAVEEGFHKKGFIFIRMEDFSNEPERIMRLIYKELNIEYYQHDFGNVPQAVSEHDPIHWPLGEHTLKNSAVNPLPEDFEQVLGKRLSEEIVKGNSWFYKAFYPERMRC